MALPSLNFRLANVLVSSFQKLIDGANQAAATLATGWTLGKIAAANDSNMLIGTEQATGTFSTEAGTPKPGTVATGASANAFRSDYAMSGQFANANWSIQVSFRSVTTAYTGTIRARLRVWASTDGTGATGMRELTGSTQVGTTVGPGSTSADTNSVITWSPGGIITLTNEFIFITVACEIVTASGSNSADALLRTGSSGTATGTNVLTSNFTEILTNKGTGTQSLSLDADKESDTSTGTGTQSLSLDADSDSSFSTGSGIQSLSQDFDSELQSHSALGIQGLVGEATSEIISQTEVSSQFLSLEALDPQTITNVGTATNSLSLDATVETVSNVGIESDSIIETIISPNVIDVLTTTGQESDSISNESLAESQTGAGSGTQTFTEATAEVDFSSQTSSQSLSLDAQADNYQTQGSGSQIQTEALAETDTSTSSSSQSITGEDEIDALISSGTGVQFISESISEIILSIQASIQSLSPDAPAETQKNTGTSPQSLAADADVETVTSVTTNTESAINQAIAEGVSHSSSSTQTTGEPDFLTNVVLSIQSIIETIVSPEAPATEVITYGQGSPGHMALFGGRPWVQQKDQLISNFKSIQTIDESIRIPQLDPEAQSSQDFSMRRIRRRRKEEELLLEGLL